jgi:signal transduction histidine kinase
MMSMSLAPPPVAVQPRGGFVEGVFSPRWRRVAVLYVCLTLPVVAVIGSQADSQAAFLRAFVYLGGGLYAVPALVVAWLTVRRVPASDRWRWRLWLGGLIFTFAIGEAVIVGLHTRSWPANRFGAVAVAVSTLLLLGVVLGLVRTRSGRLALSVDLTECAMVLVVVTAPAVLVWGDDIVSATHSWYALPATVAAVGSLAGFYWTTVLYVRLRPRRARVSKGRSGSGAEGEAEAARSEPVRLETTAVRIGLAMTFLGAVDSAAQVAQGLTDFGLPSGPVVAVHGMCVSMLLLFPLFLPSQISPGYDRLPPQAQVRGAGLAPLLTLAGLPVLLLVTMFERDRHDWAPVFSLAVVGLLALLAVLRQLLGIHETRRLYALVEKASEERRDLLTRLIQQMSNDRHNVAAQLHEQAMSAYATFASFMTAGSSADAGSPDAMTGASRMLRDDLAKQAESLRQLMLAIRPMAMERSPSDSLGPPIQAYLDSLYGDAPTPALDVTVDDDLVLDWITETIVSRIVQEAIHNVWRHSSATHITVAIGATGGQVEVRITDDGSGFDPNTNLFESGIAAMRSFAEFTNGSLHIESAPAAGTTMVARLGDPPRPRHEPRPRTPHLRLVHTDQPSPART